jgi:hypothetical protein
MADDFRRLGGTAATLKETVDAVSTQLVVNYVPGFPQNPPFDIVIDSEIITVRAIQSQSASSIGLLLSLTYGSPEIILIVSRAQESTLATKHLAGRPVVPVLTKKTFLAVGDDKGYASVRPVPASSITVKLTEGNGIFLVDPMTNDWRRFQAEEDVLPPVLSDGEYADIYAYWNEPAQETRYFMTVWSGSMPRLFTTLRNGVLVRTDTFSVTPRRYIGTVQRQGSLYTPTANRVNLATANNPTARHEGFKVVRLNPTVSGATLHGLQSARDGKTVVLSNVSTTQAVLLKHLSSSALTNEKLILPSGGDLTIPSGGGVVCVYDVVSRAWRIVNNCFIRPPRGNDPDIAQNALEDGLGNFLAYSDGSGEIILYQGGN